MSRRLRNASLLLAAVILLFAALAYRSALSIRDAVMIERIGTRGLDEAMRLQSAADRTSYLVLHHLSTNDRDTDRALSEVDARFLEHAQIYQSISRAGAAPIQHLLEQQQGAVTLRTEALVAHDRLHEELPQILDSLERSQAHTTARFRDLGVRLAQLGPGLTLHLSGHNPSRQPDLRRQMSDVKRLVAARLAAVKARTPRAASPATAFDDVAVLLDVVSLIDRLERALVSHETMLSRLDAFRRAQDRIHASIGSDIHAPAEQRIRDARARSGALWQRLRLVGAIALAAFVALSVGIVRFLRKSVMTPIAILAREADEVTAHTMGRRLPAAPAVEYTPFVTSVNLMLERLEEATVSKEHLEQSIVALQASEERFRQLFEGMREGVAYCRMITNGQGEHVDWEVLTANPAIERHVGIGPLVGRRAAVDFPALAEYPELVALFDRVVRTGETERYEGYIGRPFDTWMRVTCFRPMPGHFATISEDIGEARRARVALETAVGEWRSTFDAVEWAIVIVDAAGQVRRLNRAALGVVGGTFESRVGRRFADLGGAEPWLAAADLVSQTLAGGGSRNLETTGADGRVWDLACTGVNDIAGRPTAILMARDISSIVELQKAVRRSESMAEIGSLVVGVAHEVRNPLFAISSILDAWHAKGAAANGAQYRQVLRQEVERLKRLMVELLEYGRPNSQDSATEDVRRLIDDAVQSCQGLAAQRGVSLDVDVQQAYVLMDPSRLMRVFTNLIENAVQHSPPQGRVTIRGRAKSHGAVQIAVTDEGPGFTPEDADRVFKPFFSRRAGGFGLGLAIVHRIVEEHRGSVRVVAAGSGGGRVVVTLPPSSTQLGAA